MEKKKINIVSINAILHNVTKPGIEANKTLEIKAFLDPYSLLAYSKTIQIERRPNVTATNLAENTLNPIILKYKAVVASNNGG